ncbi:MAG: 16S rRNA (guanine(966)-N(2))-methyltransferase RsmD [Bacillota bacterium]|nr:16S rRNA (guanine(966)-N(2))-methyltransferase RsmD [Bacillota bacterium]
MRVIAGSAKGTKLKTPKGLTVRPTADRVKEALFSILGSSVIESNFLDLYAGSGAVGIEALSRGAESALFVENKKENIALIKDNLAKTRLLESARLIHLDVLKAIRKLGDENYKADLTFLDPPYDIQDLSSVVKNIFKAEIIARDGLIIVEHSVKNCDWIKNFSSYRQKKYGDTCLTLIRPELLSMR